MTQGRIIFNSVKLNSLERERIHYDPLLGLNCCRHSSDGCGYAVAALEEERKNDILDA